MKPEVVRKRIEAFERRFGRTHLIFACHGAFPLALTPDLLYKLWANFQRDIHGKVLGIPWVAVADLLLSSLCDEVGRELYEMDTAVRNSLLNRLKEDENFGQLRINELSDFLLVYVRQQLQSNDQEVRDFAQAQRWTALAYLRPNEAAQELRSALERTYKDKSEQMRLVSLIETFVEPLAEFKPLLVYARKIGDIQPSGPAIADPEVSPELGERDISDYKIPAMGKLVVIKIGEGSFELGFPVTLYIGKEGHHYHTARDGRLPPSQIDSFYEKWQSTYRINVSGRLTAAPEQVKSVSGRLTAAREQVKNVSYRDLIESSNLLQQELNKWLNSETFRPITDKFKHYLNTNETVRVIIQTEDPRLQRLPWHLWDLFDIYRKAEVALSLPEFNRVEPLVQPRAKVRILILRALSYPQTGILIDIDAYMRILESLRDAETVFLVEPNRDEFIDKLRDNNGWDILLFDGHNISSQSDATTGKMYINARESLTIPELKYALQNAIERGLQLAIFNSCDGLEIARYLAESQIPQLIVMRETVPDLVAQDFLEYFLNSFSSGESLYLAVRKARERLQVIENNFPCASWLPVIYQNPAIIPPTWQEFLNKARRVGYIQLAKSLQEGKWKQAWEGLKRILS